MTKWCPKCQMEIDHSEFYKCATARDGLQGYCKICQLELMKKYHKEHPQKVKQIRKRYYRRHKEEVIGKALAFSKQHPEKHRASQKKYQEKKRAENLVLARQP